MLIESFCSYVCHFIKFLLKRIEEELEVIVKRKLCEITLNVISGANCEAAGIAGCFTGASTGVPCLGWNLTRWYFDEINCVLNNFQLS